MADLLVGADVCCYMRSLVDLLAAAEAALSDGGVLAFSTEAAGLAEVANAPIRTGGGR